VYVCVCVRACLCLCVCACGRVFVSVRLRNILCTTILESGPATSGTCALCVPYVCSAHGHAYVGNACAG
jgi:hypothetical protein